MILKLFKKKKRRSIVIVCTANVTRSPYFEGYLKKILGEKPIPLLDDLTISSAGVDAVPDLGPHPTIAFVARDNGFSIRNHRSRRFDRKIAAGAELVLTMETEHKKRIIEQFPELEEKIFNVLEFGLDDVDPDMVNIPDPTGLDYEDFREFIDTVSLQAKRIRNVLAVKGLP